MAPDLTSYPRPNLAVDLVVLVVPEPAGSRHLELGLVVLRRADGLAVLPGRFVHERRTIRETVADLMVEKLALRPRRTTRVQMIDVYDAPDRDERGWVVSVAHATSVLTEDLARLPQDTTEVLPLHGSADRGRRLTPEHLGYDHDDMVTTAVRRARRRYERSPDPLGLLRAPYTLSQLRHVHEAVLDAPLKRDTFNRRMLPYLEAELDSRGEPVLTSETVGRPAQLYRLRRASVRDAEAGPFPLPRSTR